MSRRHGSIEPPRPRHYRAPLLDRLLDDDPGGPPEKAPLRAMDREQYGQAVLRDVGRLLNTRARPRGPEGRPARGAPEDVPTVLDYGLEDFTHLTPSASDDRASLARWVKAALDAFEPRLDVQQVTVEEIPGQHRMAAVRVEARLLSDAAPEPVSFRVVMDAVEGSIRAHGR